MKQYRNFGDMRNLGFCILCGESGQNALNPRGKLTKEHIPPKIFLDKPYPSNIHVVRSCSDCNQKHSADEEYVASFVECIIAGSVSPDKHRRAKIISILSSKKKKSMTNRIDNSKQIVEGALFWEPEQDRIDRVILKLARCHAAFEMNEPQLEAPMYFNTFALSSLNEAGRSHFEHPPITDLLPEVASRSLQRFVEKGGHQWITIQNHRYRFLVVQAPSMTIRGVIGEYLGYEVIWN